MVRVCIHSDIECHKPECKNRCRLDNVFQMNNVDRPHIVSLIDALEDVIYEIAPGNMTAAEVLGCLDVVSKNFYRDHFD